MSIVLLTSLSLHTELGCSIMRCSEVKIGSNGHYTMWVDTGVALLHTHAQAHTHAHTHTEQVPVKCAYQTILLYSAMQGICGASVSEVCSLRFSHLHRVNPCTNEKHFKSA